MKHMMDGLLPRKSYSMASDTGRKTAPKRITETAADMQIHIEPIYHLKLKTVTGYEALLYTDYDPTLDHYEQDHEHLFRQELFYRSLALNKILTLGLNKKDIYLNVNPFVIKDPSYQAGKTREYASRVGIDLERIFLCFSEKLMLEEPRTFGAAVENYRRQGYKIAIKNFGYDYSELKLDLISQFQPDVLKVDRFFVIDLHQSPLKQAYLRSLKFLTDSIGAKIIADGVQLKEEAEVLDRMQIHYIQGPILTEQQLFAGGLR